MECSTDSTPLTELLERSAGAFCGSIPDSFQGLFLEKPITSRGWGSTLPGPEGEAKQWHQHP
jgi:hypothetical protein